MHVDGILAPRVRGLKLGFPSRFSISSFSDPGDVLISAFFNLDSDFIVTYQTRSISFLGTASDLRYRSSVSASFHLSCRRQPVCPIPLLGPHL